MSKSVAIALALFVAVAAWIGSGFLGDKPQETLERAESELSEAPTKLASVQVQRLAVSSVDRILDLMGVTAANRAVSVSAQTKGAIVDIAVDSGMQIKSGARIAEIDPGDRKARVSEAKAVVTLRQSEYDAAAKLSGLQIRVYGERTANRHAAMVGHRVPVVNPYFAFNTACMASAMLGFSKCAS